MRILRLVPAAVTVWLALSCGDSTDPDPTPPAPRTNAVGIWDATITGLPGSDFGGQPSTCTGAWIMAVETTDTGAGPLQSMRIPDNASLQCGQDPPVERAGIHRLQQYLVRQSSDTVAFLEPFTLDSFLVAVFTDSLTLTGRLGIATNPTVAFHAARRSDTVDPNRAPYRLSVETPWVDVEVGDTLRVTPVVYDAYFDQIGDPPVTWSSGSPQRATIDEVGLVRGIAPGFSSIQGRIDTLVNGFTLSVLEPAASVEITAAPTTLAVSDSAEVQATARDAGGDLLCCRRFYWTSSNPGLATVSPYGETAVVRGVAPGTVTITARSTTVTASATVTVQP
jgi:hypothetical protein